VALSSASKPLTRGVQLRAGSGNTGVVYVGSSSGVTADVADATDGFPLSPGDGVLIKVDDANKVFLIASAAGQKIFFLAI
jgi:hypothetical protein